MQSHDAGETLGTRGNAVGHCARHQHERTAGTPKHPLIPDLVPDEPVSGDRIDDLPSRGGMTDRVCIDAEEPGTAPKPEELFP